MYIERGCKILEKIKLNEIRKEEKHYVAQVKYFVGYPAQRRYMAMLFSTFFFFWEETRHRNPSLDLPVLQLS